MRRLIAAAGLVVATTLLGAPAVAAAAVGTGLPLAAPASATQRPPGFTTDAQQVTALAEATRTMQALHRREHPLSYQALIWAGSQWFVDFTYHDQRVAEVVVSPAGRVIHVWTGPLSVAVYARGHYAPIFDSPWVVVTFAVLFLVPFIDPRRLRRLVLLDALVLLSFLVSYALFNHAQLVPAVWLAYPPLLYLLARMLWIGSGRSKGSTGLPTALSTRTLAIGLLVLVGARIGLSLAAHNVIDVGYASVIGAHRIVHGQSLYYASAAHADTYGPIAYLAYVPFELLFPWHGTWDYLASAHAASIVFDLITIIGLVVLGRRLADGERGRRLGLALGWAWAACPFTLLALMMHTDDGLIAMLSVLALVGVASPAARGALLGLAAAAKFAPGVLLGLFAGGRGRDSGFKGAVVCVGAFALVVVGSIALYLPSGGLSEFYNHTIGFQLSRSDVFSVWALHPSLEPLKTALELGGLLLAGAVTFVPRERSIAQIGALAAALTIAVQLPAVHWFYYYIVWFLPFVLLALLCEQSVAFEPRAGDRGPAGEPRPVVQATPETVLAGV